MRGVLLDLRGPAALKNRISKVLKNSKLSKSDLKSFEKNNKKHIDLILKYSEFEKCRSVPKVGFPGTKSKYPYEVPTTFHTFESSRVETYERPGCANDC